MNRETMRITYHEVEDESDRKIEYYNKIYAEDGWVVTYKNLFKCWGTRKNNCYVAYEREINKKGEDNMSECKPFLEIINEMKVGDVIMVHHNPDKKIEKFDDGFYWISADTDEPVDMVELNYDTVVLNFKKLPKYVSMTEAFDALNKGKKIRGWKGFGYYEFGTEDTFKSMTEYFPSLKFSDLPSFKWTIVD
ncbi:hypothetical protein WKH56_19725 [Priestia sp. SB1]|uniref:hypothetical protein n=1 Tax=Priestia sp. SB1 TaxID=3132359 RepID=UPI00316DFBB6